MDYESDSDRKGFETQTSDKETSRLLSQAGFSAISYPKRMLLKYPLHAES